MPDPALHARRIVLVVAGIGAIVAAAVLGVLWGLGAFDIPHGGERRERAYRLTVPGPNLQSAPQPDLGTYFTEKRRQLGELAWLDASRTTARIPLEAAMALIASGAVDASVATPTVSPASAPFGVRRWPAQPPAVAPPVGAPADPPNTRPEAPP